MGVLKEDMAEVGVTEEDAKIGETGDGKSAVAIPDGKMAKERRRRYLKYVRNALGRRAVESSDNVVELCQFYAYVLYRELCFSLSKPYSWLLGPNKPVASERPK